MTLLHKTMAALALTAAFLAGARAQDNGAKAIAEWELMKVAVAAGESVDIALTLCGPTAGLYLQSDNLAQFELALHDAGGASVDWEVVSLEYFYEVAFSVMPIPSDLTIEVFTGSADCSAYTLTVTNTGTAEASLDLETFEVFEI